MSVVVCSKNTQSCCIVKPTLLNLAKGYSLASSAALLQWNNIAPSVRAGFVKGTHFHDRTCRRPSFAFICLYPQLESVEVRGGESLKKEILRPLMSLGNDISTGYHRKKVDNQQIPAVCIFFYYIVMCCLSCCLSPLNYIKSWLRSALYLRQK